MYGIKTSIVTTLLSVLFLLAGCSTSNGVDPAIDEIGWGPSRETFSMGKPASYPTFNSIVDNPTIGDERDFVRVGQINEDVTNMQDSVEVVKGHQYLVYVYYHNNASATYNGVSHEYSGVAINTRLSTSFSETIGSDNPGIISATISADNAIPKSVWDSAMLTTSEDKVALSYVAGSAKIYNDGSANQWIMPSSLFTEEGALLGFDDLNGLLPGCEEYHGIVTYVIQAE